MSNLRNAAHRMARHLPVIKRRCNLKIYIAASFFKHKEEVEYVVRSLRKNPHYSVYAPMEFKLKNAWDYTNEEWGKLVFDADLAALDSADVAVVLCYAGDDGSIHGAGGTPWEAGYCCGCHKPYIAVHLEEGKASLMIANGTKYNVSSIEELLSIDLEHPPVRQCTVPQT